jgi:hypothetical protein
VSVHEPMTCVDLVYTRCGFLDVACAPGSCAMIACVQLAAWTLCVESI